VIEATLDLSQCLDLTRRVHQDLVKDAFQRLAAEAADCGRTIPDNVDFGFDPSGERKNRRRDRLVINGLCEETALAAARGASLPLGPFTSVIGVFQEGRPIYPGAGFHANSHVQVAVRDLGVISGVKLAS
jgi:hypothetical protein